MANKFPLIADGSAIKELPSGDNLDLTGSGISISGGQGTSGQVLSQMAAPWSGLMLPQVVAELGV